MALIALLLHKRPQSGKWQARSCTTLILAPHKFQGRASFRPHDATSAQGRSFFGSFRDNVFWYCLCCFKGSSKCLIPSQHRSLATSHLWRRVRDSVRCLLCCLGQGQGVQWGRCNIFGFQLFFSCNKEVFYCNHPLWMLWASSTCAFHQPQRWCPAPSILTLEPWLLGSPSLRGSVGQLIIFHFVVLS